MAYRPAYSPDLNPIGKALSKLKGRLRAAAERTVPEVEQLLGELPAALAPGECHNYLRSCGYPAATPDREPL